MESHATVWTGTAFMCPASNNQIILLHNRFNNESSKDCNGNIMVVSTEVNGNKYTSQINITFNSFLIGKFVECFSDDGHTSSLVANYTIISEDQGIIIVKVSIYDGIITIVVCSHS